VSLTSFRGDVKGVVLSANSNYWHRLSGQFLNKFLNEFSYDQLAFSAR